MLTTASKNSSAYGSAWASAWIGKTWSSTPASRMRFQLSVGQLENHNRISDLKRDVARLKTILRERELEGESA